MVVFFGGDMSSIGEENVPHHVGGKPIKDFKGMKVFEECQNSGS